MAALERLDEGVGFEVVGSYALREDVVFHLAGLHVSIDQEYRLRDGIGHDFVLAIGHLTGHNGRFTRQFSVIRK